MIDTFRIVDEVCPEGEGAEIAQQTIDKTISAVVRSLYTRAQEHEENRNFVASASLKDFAHLLEKEF